jgi:hypothetical protein
MKKVGLYTGVILVCLFALSPMVSAERHSGSFSNYSFQFGFNYSTPAYVSPAPVYVYDDYPQVYVTPRVYVYPAPVVVYPSVSRYYYATPPYYHASFRYYHRGYHR